MRSGASINFSILSFHWSISSSSGMKVLNANFLILKVENDNVFPFQFEIGSTDRILLKKMALSDYIQLPFIYFWEGFSASFVHGRGLVSWSCLPTYIVWSRILGCVNICITYKMSMFTCIVIWLIHVLRIYIGCINYLELELLIRHYKTFQFFANKGRQGVHSTFTIKYL